MHLATAPSLSLVRLSPATLKCHWSPQRIPQTLWGLWLLLTPQLLGPGPQGQGGENRRKFSGVPLGRAKDPVVMRRPWWGRGLFQEDPGSQALQGGKARLSSDPGQAERQNFPRRLRTQV